MQRLLLTAFPVDPRTRESEEFREGRECSLDIPQRLRGGHPVPECTRLKLWINDLLNIVSILLVI